MIKKAKFELNTFLDYVKENQMYYLDYMEIVLDSDGLIYTVVPSHEKIIMEIASDIEDYDVEKFLIENDELSDFYIDKLNLVSIRFSCYVCGTNGINEKQNEAISELINRGLLSKNLKVYTTNAYKKYLYRKSMVEDT